MFKTIKKLYSIYKNDSNFFDHFFCTNQRSPLVFLLCVDYPRHITKTTLINIYCSDSKTYLQSKEMNETTKERNQRKAILIFFFHAFKV
jgi:hypothetical protein